VIIARTRIRKKALQRPKGPASTEGKETKNSKRLERGVRPRKALSAKGSKAAEKHGKKNGRQQIVWAGRLANQAPLKKINPGTRGKARKVIPQELPQDSAPKKRIQQELTSPRLNGKDGWLNQE